MPTTEAARSPSRETDETAQAVLALLHELSSELRPGRPVPGFGLDSSLERDLGIDSLGRAEMLLRLERRFDVGLSDRLITTAETPRDLVREVLAARPAEARETVSVPRFVSPTDAVGAPGEARTLAEMLDWHVASHPDRQHVLIYDDSHEDSETLTYADLRSRAGAVAAGLWAEGVEPGQSVAIMLPTGKDFFFAFLGIVLAGAVPVPIYPPFRASQIEDHLRRQAGILGNALVTTLITVTEARAVARLLKPQVPSLKLVTTVAELSSVQGAAPAIVLRPQDVTLIQYTSGSTGNPKGVVLTHANLLTNIRAYGQAIAADSDDVFVSWLPLYHDMGLIGAWLGCLYYAAHLIVMSPLTFLVRPERWLWDISNHRATLSAAPNFAYELCVRRIEESALEGLDLSSWRRTINGAEPVSPGTIERFARRFAKYGFRPEAMAPVFGLAESTVGLAFPPLGRGPIVDHVQREPLTVRGEAVPADEGDAAALDIVACGRPLVGHEVRIVDDRGREVGERREGRLQFRGPSSTSGYFRNPEETRRLFSGDWLEAGDRAYIAEGDIYITGRIKDIIIRAGRNVYPHEVEDAVGDVPGVRTGCVAVFGSTDADTGTERLIVLAETRETDPAKLETLRHDVSAVATDVVAMPPEEVVLAPPHTVLKTSSGKIRRAACRDLFEQGRIGARGRAVWWQVTRLALAAIVPQLRGWLRFVGDQLYAAYWWSVLGVVGIFAWILVALLWQRRGCWFVIRGAARLVLRLHGTPLTVRGVENLPREGRYVLVSNHSSYLDSLVLSAALPGSPVFVAKQELAGQFVAGILLRRLGARFVERFEHAQSVEDTRRLVDAARGESPLAFFPEGTLSRMPGLLPFRQGAFVVAAQAGSPVVPVTIRGTRSILRGDQWFPRRGAVQVVVAPPIASEGEDWSAAIKLRDAVRAVILASCGEPDLSHETAETYQPREEERRDA